MPRKAEYARRKAAGLCPSCGVRPPAPERVSCQECLDRMKERKKERDEERKAAGMCTNHPDRPAVEGKTYCQECLDWYKERAEERREELKAAGICIDCGQTPATIGSPRCQECACKAYTAGRRYIRKQRHARHEAYWAQKEKD